MLRVHPQRTLRVSRTHPRPRSRISKRMANPNRNPEPDWRERGWESIEGGARRDETTRGSGATNDNADAVRDDTRGTPMRRADHPLLGNDYRDAGAADDAPVADRRRSTSTDETPVREVPTSGGTLRILVIVLGLLLFGALTALMFFRFQQPSPRSPEQPSGRMYAPAVYRTVVHEPPFVPCEARARV